MSWRISTNTDFLYDDKTIKAYNDTMKKYSPTKHELIGLWIAIINILMLADIVVILHLLMH